MSKFIDMFTRKLSTIKDDIAAEVMVKSNPDVISQRAEVMSEERRKVVETPETKRKRLVQEIHEAFNTAGVEAIGRAQGKIQKVPVLSEDTEVFVEKVIEAGFGNSKSLKGYRDFKSKISGIKSENKHAAQIIQDIQMYQQRYPLYKVITEQDYQDLCRKYNLYSGSTRIYTGEIPTKNMKDVVNFKLAKEDDGFIFTAMRTPRGSSRWGNSAYPILEFFHTRKETEDRVNYVKQNYYLTNEEIVPAGKYLYIAAPKEDFDLNGQKVQGREISAAENIVPDPIVTYKLNHGSDNISLSCRLIVTAWGEEAADPLILNVIHN